MSNNKTKITPNGLNDIISNHEKNIQPLLSNISNFLIAIGSVLNKAPTTLPNVAIIKLFSQLFLILGNTTWAKANTYGSQAKRDKNKWYGFANFNTQQIIAALLGASAAIFTILSLLVPVFLPIACWIAAMGNIFWTTSEYHRKNNKNPLDALEHESKQVAYWKYTLAMTGVSLLTAVSASLIFLFPPATLIASVVTGALCVALATVGVLHLMESLLTKTATYDPFVPNCQLPNEISVENNPINLEQTTPIPKKTSCFTNLPPSLFNPKDMPKPSGFTLFQPHPSSNPTINPVESDLYQKP